MIFAALEGDVETVRSLLKKGLPVDTRDFDDRTTLHLAAKEGNVKVVEALLNESADPNVRDRWGSTPLQHAVTYKHGRHRPTQNAAYSGIVVFINVQITHEVTVF